MKADEDILLATGKNASHWMKRIGTLVTKHSYKIKGGKGLEACHSDRVMADLAKEVFRAIKPNCNSGTDENIYLAKVLGLILVLWSVRIARAKGYDPRRELSGRRSIITATMPKYAASVISCLVDQSMDAAWFPDQEWDDPCSPNARYEPDDMELKRQEYDNKCSSKKGKK